MMLPVHEAYNDLNVSIWRPSKSSETSCSKTATTDLVSLSMKYILIHYGYMLVPVKYLAKGHFSWAVCNKWQKIVTDSFLRLHTPKLIVSNLS